jgi:hypothetical protein
VERVGKCCPIVWDVKWSNSKIMKKLLGVINRSQSANQHMTTKQKKAFTIEESM